MSQTVEAIYENGAFRPVEPVSIPEHKRVKLTIEESNTARDDADREAARAAMIAGFDKLVLHSGGRLPTRSELHERD